MIPRQDLYRFVARWHTPSAFFCEYLFYAAQALLERPEFTLISYPKCGRTWIHFMIVRYFALRFGVEEADRLITMARRDNRIPKILLSHDGKCSRFWNRSKSTYRATSVIFMVRDPRDAVVSHYNHCRHRDRVYHDTLTSFIRHPYYGIAEIIRFMNHWNHVAGIPKAFHLCRYEDFQAETEKEMRTLLSFIGDAEPDERALSKALEDGSINSMRQREESGNVRLSGLERLGESSESMKVRQGKVGGYRSVMDADDIDFVDEQVAHELDPEFGYR